MEFENERTTIRVTTRLYSAALAAVARNDLREQTAPLLFEWLYSFTHSLVLERMMVSAPHSCRTGGAIHRR